MQYKADFKSLPARLVAVPEKIFVPRTKAKLLETIRSMRPDYNINKMRGFSKARLYAIYFTLRKRAAQAEKEHC